MLKKSYAALYEVFSRKLLMSRKQRIIYSLSIWAVVATVFCIFMWRAYSLTDQERERARERVAAMSARDAAITSLVHASAHGVAVLDHEGHIQEWNPALEEWTGIPADKMIGGHIDHLMDRESARRHRNAFNAAIDEENSQVEGEEVRRIECDLFSVDGRRIPVIIHVYIVTALEKPYAIALIAKQQQVKQVTQE